MVYYLVTLLAVFLLHHDPTSWPPIFDQPWAATSLHDFWSKRWHQLLRHTFLTLGGYPLQALFGLPGLVFGTFLASGLYHHWALYAMGRGNDRTVIWFFVLQAVGVSFERLLFKSTGWKVNGWFGTAWVWLWIVGGGQGCSKFAQFGLCAHRSMSLTTLILTVNAWLERGFAGGFVIPPQVSPTRRFLIPLVTSIVKGR